MAVKIRLTRLGDKKSPFYRVVVADSRTSRDGKVIEKLGTYDTKKDPAVVNIDVEKAKDWLSKGAQPTETAKTVLVKAGVLEASTKKTAPKSDKKKKA